MKLFSKSVKDVLSVAGSNILILLSGVFAGFILPKIMEVSDYGLYKTYALYLTYLGVFSFGILDGVALKYGKYNFDELPKEKMRAIFKLLLSVLIFVAIVGLIISAILSGNIGASIIVFFCALNVVFVNISGLFQHISQITQRFKEYSFRNVIKSSLTVIAICGLLCAYMMDMQITYVIYIAILTVINLVMAGWYVYTYRQLIFGKSVPFKEMKADFVELIKIGIPLMFATLSSTILLSLDRQFVNVLFDLETYAVYAFAYNMFSLVTTLTNAMASVLYPKLKRQNAESLKENYPTLVAFIMTFVFLALGLYFPLCWFIEWFLPNYVGSLVIFRIIFPALVVDAVIMVVISNYFKTMNESANYFKRSLVVLAVAFATNLAAYLLFKSTVAISIASVITMLFNYVLMDSFIRKQIGRSTVKNLLFLIICMIGFYAVTEIKNLILGAVVYLLLMLLITMVFYRKEMWQYLQKIRLKNHDNSEAE